MVILFAAVLGLYVLGFSWLEHRRVRQGPWNVRFLKEPDVPPLILINQPALRITNVQVVFPEAPWVQPTNSAMEFVAGREPPFAVPFGECLFMDPLFLPGSVSLELFGHRIEMLPRGLTLDGQRHEWSSEDRFEMTRGRRPAEK